MSTHTSMSFDEKVWRLMKEIPTGKVTTYKLIAEKIGCKAYRAVGNACRRNPYAPVVPCHRVVKSDGGIGGFGGKTSGAKIKKKIALLRKEGVEVKNEKIVNFKRILHRYKS
ncbi:MGMT family protein [[Eubacterium] cellulosolvens]